MCGGLKENAPQKEWHSWECGLAGVGVTLLVEVCHMQELFGISYMLKKPPSVSYYFLLPEVKM